MNTATATRATDDQGTARQDAPDLVPADPASRPKRRGRILIALVSVLLMAVGLVTVDATSASASTPATASVCFIHTTGGPYTYQQYAQYWNGSSWVNAGVQQSTSGCTRWNLTGGHHWRFQAFIRVGRATFLGNSAWSWTNAGVNYNFGTNYVHQYGSN